jgi:hypothetical protein
MLIIAAPRPAFAQAQDEAMARAPFDESPKLATAGQYAQAFPEFEVVRRFFGPGTGVLPDLADCYVKTGRTASARTTFGEATSVVRREGRRDDEIEAKGRQASLEPRLSRLSTRVTKEVAGLTLKKDGGTIARGTWDVPSPIDPGVRPITAEAPSRRSWKQALQIADATPTTTVQVPELSPVAPPALSLPVRPQFVDRTERKPSPGDTQRAIGWVVAGAAVQALLAGTIIGLVAKGQDNRAALESGLPRHTDSVNAAHFGDLATVVFVAGAAAAASAVVLWLTAPSASAQIGTNGREVLFRGVF